MSIAASLLLIIWVGLYAIFPSHTIDQTFIKSPAEGWVIKKNFQKTAQTVRLPDGSTVLLKPNSTVRYRSGFTSANREVYLDGEGFFEVVHNEKQPFLVYAREVTAKVLGTSFSVRAFKHDKEILVAVKTGKVAVDTHSSTGSRPSVPEVILTPNTEIIYNENNKRLAKRIIETPLPLLPTEEIKRMRFVDAPLKEVFEAIEKIYGVDLVFDDATYASCILTTSVSDEGIYKRLDIISDAIGIKYTVVEDKIVITGRGCR
jgi:ferric-dicitrate binding protein FerR (iron transport regulator)